MMTLVDDATHQAICDVTMKCYNDLSSATDYATNIAAKAASDPTYSVFSVAVRVALNEIAQQWRSLANGPK
jgi:hypothetical protein